MSAQARTWLLIGAAALGLLYLLSGVLAPFIAGMAAAYFLDPVAGRIERLGLSRTMATLIITAAFFGVAVGIIVVLAPLVETQVADFIVHIPDYKHSLEERTGPLVRRVMSHLSNRDVDRLRSALGEQAGAVGAWALGMARTVVGSVLAGGAALIGLLSLAFITPIVTFYMLRDWPRMVTRVKCWLPRAQAPVIVTCVQEIDTTLSAFVRGQALVCLAMAALYGVGLTAIGVDLGLVIGIGAGLLSFVPYLGTLSGLTLAVGMTFAQSGDWRLPAMAGGVFLFGHLLESNVLTPNLVGDRIGLHPLWIMFALLTGGAGLGFAGVMLAVPVAAVVGVIVRAMLVRYLTSPLYLGPEQK